jgi:hypothetical protein
VPDPASPCQFSSAGDEGRGSAQPSSARPRPSVHEAQTCVASKAGIVTGVRLLASQDVGPPPASRLPGCRRGSLSMLSQRRTEPYARRLRQPYRNEVPQHHHRDPLSSRAGCRPSVLNNEHRYDCGKFGTKRRQVQILSPRLKKLQVTGLGPIGVRAFLLPVQQRSTATGVIPGCPPACGARLASRPSSLGRRSPSSRTGRRGGGSP